MNMPRPIRCPHCGANPGSDHRPTCCIITTAASPTSEIGELIERLRNPAWVHSAGGFGSYSSPQLDIESTQAAMEEAAAALASISERTDEANATIARVWKALGIETYEQAGGQEISEIVADYKQAAGVEAGLRREFLARAEAAEAALADIDKIVHTPTKETRHKIAADHFQADFDAIRKLTARYRAPVSTSYPTCAKCGCDTKGETALVGDQTWCHPCADLVSGSTEGGNG